ncbi:MAG: dipeptidyl aminopeptidase/acylaminoacyl peptidase [Planctomycetota bacterium]|jgi:dipeptidyl aminopeptidase/acylaminoacyl peptidase
MKGSRSSMRLFAIAIFTVCCTGLMGQSPENGLTPFDVATLRTVRDVIPSPDGKSVLITRTEPRLAGEPAGSDYLHLYLSGMSGEFRPRLLIGGKKQVRGVAYSPDGKQVTFLDRREEDSGTQVYAMPMNGGESTRITKAPFGVSSYKWRSDGERIAFTSRMPLPNQRATDRKHGFKPVFVDEGLAEYRLFTCDSDGGDIQPVTKSRSVVSFEWAPSGKTIVFAAATTSSVDDSYVGCTLYQADMASGKVRVAAKNLGKLGGYAVSPDDKKLAWIGAVDVRDPHAGMLFMTDLSDGNTRLVTQEFVGMMHQVIWRDVNNLVAVASYGARTYVGLVELLTGKITPLGGGKGLAFRHIALVPGDPRSVVTAASNARFPAEAFRLVVGTDPIRLSYSNPWLNDYAMGKQDTITIKARDGLPIEGLLIRPINHDPKKRYPLVIIAHGGPEAHFSEGWNTSYSTWGQMLAARGYFAWLPNYRSSTGYGVEFAKKDHGDPMGAEFNDHLDAIKVFSDQGLIDSKRVGIGGGSYGGYTAAWAATKHSEHFAAAVSFVPFTHIRTKWYTSDIPTEFYNVHYEEKHPHEQKAFLDSRSPLEFAEQCHTPLLLLGGDKDPRVHPSQPFMLYRAVKMATKTPTRYIQYSNEGHGNRINTNRYDYSVRSLRWFDHFLKSGEHRSDPLPALDVDYSGWKSKRSD